MEKEDILQKPTGSNDTINYDKYKQTLGKQYRRVFLTYLVTSVVIGILGMLAALNLIVTDDGSIGLAQIVLSVIMILVQGMVIYATTYDIATHDIKPYSTLKSSKDKGIKLVLPAVILGIILTVLYVVVWAAFGKDTIEHGSVYEALKLSGAPNFASWFDHNKAVRVMPNAFGVVVNFVYMIWIFPYYALIQPLQGHVNVVGVVSAIILPLLFGYVGYVAGMKKIDLTLFWNKLMYDNKNDIQV